MMVGSWPCRVSSEVHINGRRVSDPIREDKGKAVATGQEDEKDPTRARVMLSQGREVVGPGYSKLSSAAATLMDKGRSSDILNRVTQVGDKDGQPGNMETRKKGKRSGQVGRVSNTKQEPRSASWVANTEQHSVTMENRVTQDSRGRKPEEGKRVAPSQKLVARWCLRGITKTQRRRLQKMCQKELAKEEEQRDYWFNRLCPMTKVKQTWRENG
jgi:hypothetical protein